MPSRTSDVVVIGGGIVGVATAHALVSADGPRVVVLEAEPRLAQHQTGRNSGVIHSGLYYRPGSEKARLCTAGREALYEFLDSRRLPFRRCGKLVVATEERQLAALAELTERARENGLTGTERLQESEIREREPAAAGIAGLWVPQTGVVDFAAVTRELARELCQRGGEVVLDASVERILRRGSQLQIRTRRGELSCGLVINCAGLRSDRVARLTGIDPQIRLIPFRGEYYEIAGPSRELVRGLIYPVPDPRFPFLGIHLTRTADDRVLAGPNAVPALKREGYHRLDVSLVDIVDTVTFPGFWRLAGGLWRTGLAEIRRSFSKSAFARETRRLVPAIDERHLRPARSGVRAQAVDRSGRLIDDFFILRQENMIHVLNAPSPAATAALAIGDHIAHEARALL